MTAEEIYKKIDEIENKMSKIYFEIMRAEKISAYKRQLLSKKLLLLAYQYKVLIDKFIKCKENEAKKIKRDKILIALEFTLYMISITFGSFIWIIPGSLLIFGQLCKILPKILDNNTEEMMNELKAQSKKIEIMTKNCYTFMESKCNKKEKELIEENTLDSISIISANQILDFYLMSGILVIPYEEIKPVLIKILQDDLKTEEENLETLLEMASKKIEYENLNEELGLGLNLKKFQENIEM